MGIKHFFSWFRRNELLKQVISDFTPHHVDHVLIDMNGVIHEAAQHVFKYGKCKSRIQLPRHLKAKAKRPTDEDLYRKIKEIVNDIIDRAQPHKSIYLAIDGVAPKSKQNQQRQRRFRAAKERVETDPDAFDSNCITAGTPFMRSMSDNLARLDWIKKRPNVTVHISTDAEPGEGEHKLINWMRVQQENNDVFCVVGLDADLILLCCMVNKENVFIMRENERNEMQFIDIAQTRRLLPIPPDDFVVLSCFIGNDFLPPIPTLEIKESAPEMGALDYFLQEVKEPLVFKTGARRGGINLTYIKQLLAKFMEREQAIMSARALDEERFENTMWKGDIEQYRCDYHKIKLNGCVKADVIKSYMKTVQWVFDYYSKPLLDGTKLRQSSQFSWYQSGVPSWDWYYPFNYTLHANDFVTFMPTNIVRFRFHRSKPSHHHEQLLRVIPSINRYLIPDYLLKEFDRITKEATTFKIDKSGKRQDWEAVTIVDFVNPQVDSDLYHD